MTPKAVVFDIDDTLVDTSMLKSLRDDARKRRQWNDVYARLSDTVVFDGVQEMVEALRRAGVKIAMVTNSPHAYATRLLSHHRLYHDHLEPWRRGAAKPDPTTCLAALSALSIPASDTIGVGDNEKDLGAYQRSRISTAAAAWSPATLMDLPWDHKLETPMDLLKLVGID